MRLVDKRDNTLFIEKGKDGFINVLLKLKLQYSVRYVYLFK